MPMTGPRISINDTTLRDGEQAPGVAFTQAEKLEIAQALAGAGADEIEAGTPAMGREVVDDIAALVRLNLPLRIVAWCRLICDDVDAALAAGVKTINLSAPMSDAQIAVKFGGSRAAMLVALRDVAGYARRRGLTVALGGEDSSRAAAAELAPVLDLARELGIVRFRFADTLGVLDPFGVSERVGMVRRLTDIPIEFHGHDDLGLATANTLAALRAGASHASVTVLGLGERAGNAPLEQVAVAVGRLGLGQTAINPTKLRALAEIVAQAARRDIARDKPIIGDDIFTHESGIHVAGLLKSRSAYEALAPEMSSGVSIASCLAVIPEPARLPMSCRGWAPNARRTRAGHAARHPCPRPDHEGAGQRLRCAFHRPGSRQPACPQMCVSETDTGSFDMSVLDELKSLDSAEAFFHYLDVTFDPAILGTLRLHILKRMGQDLGRLDLAQSNDAEVRAAARRSWSKLIASSRKRARSGSGCSRSSRSTIPSDRRKRAARALSRSEIYAPPDEARQVVSQMRRRGVTPPAVSRQILEIADMRRNSATGAGLVRKRAR